MGKLDPNDPAVIKVYKYGPYGYIPNGVAPIIFTAVFGLLAVWHTVLLVRHHRLRKREAGSGRANAWWWSIVPAGCIFEATGHAIRIHGHSNSTDINPYIAQQCLLVITPVLFAAAQFTLLGRLLQMYPRSSWIRPAWVIIGFVTVDVISLIVQGTGSGIAAVAEIDGYDTRDGGNIVLGGLAVQLLAYVAFDFLFVQFCWKEANVKRGTPSGRPESFVGYASHDSQGHSENSTIDGEKWAAARRLEEGQRAALKPDCTVDAPLRNYLVATFVAALLILWRSCFRTGEMAAGWVSEVATTEWYFYAFDAAPVSLAVLVMAIWWLPKHIV